MRLEWFKNIFRSKRKRLILDLKKKQGKDVSQEDINEYRKKSRKYPDAHSDNDILELMISDIFVAKENNSCTRFSSSRTSDDYFSSHSYHSSCGSSSSCSSSSSD